MEEKNVYIASFIQSPSALTREQGTMIYNEIIPCLNHGMRVILDFKDIESLLTPFLNVAIGKLYEDFNSEQLNSRLEVINIPEGTASKFNMVIKNAKLYYANKNAFNKAVEDVMNNE